MKSQSVRLLFFVPLALCLAIACTTKKPAERCSNCGMSVQDAPGWAAGLSTGSGADKSFCSPRCMFAWMLKDAGKGSRDSWVTEYYTQKRTPTKDVYFVIGSDISGPMGPSLVPVAGFEAAERFVKDHAGKRIFAAEEITPEVLRRLKQ